MKNKILIFLILMNLLWTVNANEIKNNQESQNVETKRNEETEDKIKISNENLDGEEWKIFFSGFYNEYGKGVDNTLENADYHTGVRNNFNIKSYMLSDKPKKVTIPLSFTWDNIKNIFFYGNHSTINNNGTINLGNSNISNEEEDHTGLIRKKVDKYSIGIYGYRSYVNNNGTLGVGKYGIGILSEDSNVQNNGLIRSNEEGAIGVFISSGNFINNVGGMINLSGDKSIGIYGVNLADIRNNGTINIQNSSYGVYLNSGSRLENYGVINITGNDSAGVVLDSNSVFHNLGTLNVSGIRSSYIIMEESYQLPSLINGGIINVSENFELDGVKLIIKVDPQTLRVADTSDASFIADSVKFYAPSFKLTKPVEVTSDFAIGTNANVYKLADVFNLMNDEWLNGGSIKVVSRSLTWEAIPTINENGNVDIWMKRKDYSLFSDGLWYEKFAGILDKNYSGTSGNSGTIFDKIDTIETEQTFRKVMSSLTGDIYSNISKRDNTILGVFDSSLKLLQDSPNIKGENVKINIIGGKGKNLEETDGLVEYNYTTTGIMALGETEKMNGNKLGFSLGYLYTDFNFGESENLEKVNSVQAGIHSVKKSNNLTIKNNLTISANLHDMKRNIDWEGELGKSKMNSRFETYLISSENTIGKNIKFGKSIVLVPYSGFKATYMIRPDFQETGLEALEVKENESWSLKPRVGIEIKGIKSIGKKEHWKLRGEVDLAYEYELGDLNKKEEARLIAVSEEFHSLSKPQNEKGIFKTKAMIGVENKYGIFVTGEYSAGKGKSDNYKAGVELKISF